MGQAGSEAATEFRQCSTYFLKPRYRCSKVFLPTTSCLFGWKFTLNNLLSDKQIIIQIHLWLFWCLIILIGEESSIKIGEGLSFWSLQGRSWAKDVFLKLNCWISTDLVMSLSELVWCPNLRCSRLRGIWPNSSSNSHYWSCYSCSYYIPKLSFECSDLSCELFSLLYSLSYSIIGLTSKILDWCTSGWLIIKDGLFSRSPVNKNCLL